MPSDCVKCTTTKRFCGFPNATWFPVSAIGFCRVQMVFLLFHLRQLEDGIYPRNPQDSNYVDPGVRSQSRQTAPFETPAQLFSEVDTRLKMLPNDTRDLLLESVESEKAVWEYRDGARMALNFISGFQRPIAFCPDCNGVTILQLGKYGTSWTQVCEDCKKTWGHLSYTSWKAERNYREKEKRMHICEKCGGTRWKTKVKGEVWVCRKCGAEKTKEVNNGSN